MTERIGGGNDFGGSRRVLEGGVTHDEIETALQNYEHVVLVGDHSSLSDRITVPRGSVTIETAPGATVRIADGATPKTHQDQQGNDFVALIYSDQNDDVTVLNRGTLDGNNTNHGPSHCVFIDHGKSPRVHSPGRLEDANVAVLCADCTNEHHGTLQGFNCQSTYGNEGCVGGSVEAIYQEGGDLPAANINGRSVGTHLGTVIHDGGTNYAVDVNESPETVIDTLIGVNTPYSLLRITGQAGRRWSDSAIGSIGHSDDCTVKAARGRTTNPALAIQGTDPIRGLTLDNVNVVSRDYQGVKIHAAGDGSFDGLRASGYAESEAGYSGWDISGEGNQQDGAHLDVEGVSSGSNGVKVQDWRSVTGTLRGFDCTTAGTAGVRPTSSTGNDCNDWDVTVVAKGNDFGFLNKAAATNCTIRGVATGNANTDVRIDAGTAPYRLDMTYGTFSFNAGGAVTEAQYA